MSAPDFISMFPPGVIDWETWLKGEGPAPVEIDFETRGQKMDQDIARTYLGESSLSSF